MDDLISRQAAIDFIDAGHLVNPNEPRWSDNEVVGFLKSRPPAQPEQRWILCSERLPSGQTEVIVSCLDDSGDTPFDYTSCGWCTNDGEYWIVDNEINNYVIAWMPLPEPWKGEEDA